jgi:ribosomal 30S subunit maturation factor RimM
LEDERGAPLGEITDVLTPGATPVLVVQGGAGEIMIPLADAFVHEGGPRERTDGRDASGDDRC